MPCWADVTVCLQRSVPQVTAQRKDGALKQAVASYLQRVSQLYKACHVSLLLHQPEAQRVQRVPQRICRALVDASQG